MNQRWIRSSIRQPVGVLFVGALILWTCTVTYGLAAGRLLLTEAVFYVAGPWAALAAAFRPDWLLLALIALPASVTVELPLNRMLLLMVIALGALMITRPAFSLALRTAITPLIVLLIAGWTFEADVGAAAEMANDSLMLSIAYYILTAILAFNLSMLGDLRPHQLASAFIVGVFSTLALALAGYGTGWFPSGTSVISRYYFAYLAVGGLGVGIVWILRSSERRGRTLALLLTSALAFLSLASLVRAAWIAAAATFSIHAWRSGRRILLISAVLAAASSLLIPGARQELASSETGDIAEAFRTGEITTGRWVLWVELWERSTSALPWGNGFGYMWSLSSEDLFGTEGQFTGEFTTLIYPHNDFLFLFVEFGFLGVLLLAWFWVGVFRAYVTAARSSDKRVSLHTQMLLGIVIIGFAMTLVDQLFAIRPFAERFFPVVGLILALAQSERTRRRYDQMGGAPRRLDSASG